MALAERAWCVVVPHHPRGARVARQRLAGVLSEYLHPPELADVVTITAELVGNAVLHAEPLPGGVIRVAWRVWPAGYNQLVRVRVTDGGAVERPSIRTVDPDASEGRGLAIVAALADRWGVERDGFGQSVWAELSAAIPGPVPCAQDGALRAAPGTTQMAGPVGTRPAQDGTVPAAVVVDLPETP